jgi:bifunctional DNA-binding transcriptional regulator/antitoxin component of YhaV-PrlF toxin-antitoxin module
MTSILSSNFQLSVPKAICEAQRWKAGQELVFIPKGRGVLIIPAPELQDLAGIVKEAPKNYRDRNDRW